MPFSFVPSPSAARRKPQAAEGRKPEEEKDLKMYSLAKPNTGRPQTVPSRGGAASSGVVEPLPVTPRFKVSYPASAANPALSPASVSAPRRAPAPQTLSAQISAPAPPVLNAAVPAQMPAMSPVDRFRNANRGLPDGVQYEPLDQETLRLLKQTGALNPNAAQTEQQQPQINATQVTHPVPQQMNAAQTSQPAPQSAYAPQAPHTAQQQPPPQVSQPMYAPRAPMIPAAPSQPISQPATREAELIERLMQDERNAKVFYGHLAEAAPRADAEAAMKDMSESCAARLKSYDEICARLSGKRFTPKETEINTGISFEDGIALAISEENKSARVLTEWLDGKPDADTARMLQNIINKKITNLNLLTLMNSNLNFPFKF